MVFGLGNRKLSGKNAPEEKAREEVRFWKYELDRCVDEKNKWMERFKVAARHNEILRAEVFLLQQDTSAQRQHSAWRQHLSSRAEHARGRSEHVHSRNEPAREHVLRTPAPAAQSSRQEPVQEDEFIPTPASKRFQAPGSGSKSSARYSNTDASSKLRDEVENLKQLLQEAHAQNSSLRGEIERQQKQNDFLTASAEAYKNETRLLREELLTQHGINDETADETVKVLSELGRLQQDNALLTRDVQLKDSMIQLLQQELCEMNNQVLPTPRARSPERSSISSLGGTEAVMMQSLWEMEHQQQLLWEAVQHLPEQPSAALEGRGFEQAAAEYLDTAHSSGEGLDDRDGSQLAAAAGTWGSERLDSHLLSSSSVFAMHSQAGAQESRSEQYPDAFGAAGQCASEAVQSGCYPLEPAEALSPSSSVDTRSVPDVDPAHQAPPGKASSRNGQQQRQRGREGKQSRVSARAVIVAQKPAAEFTGHSSSPRQLCAVSDGESDQDDVGRRVGIRTPDSYGHRFAALHS